MDVGNTQLDWRFWSEKTMLDGFRRMNVGVTAAGEPEVTVFLYREVR